MQLATAIYSCDDHLDLRAVPPGLWETRLASADAARGPHVIERDDELVWVCEGRELGGSGYAGAAGERIRALNAIGRAGIDDDGYRAGRADLRLQDMDRDGLAASVVYGPLAIGLPIEDPALQAACFAAWNDWAADEFNAVAPERLTTLPFLPSTAAQVAADELERCAAKGHRGAIIDVFDMDLGDPAWDRLWNVAQDTGLPISVHIKGGSWSGLSYQIGKWQAAAFATIMPLQLDEILATLIFSGILERHPGLQIVMAESGVSWLPFFLARADMEWNALKSKLDYAPALSPSELFARQVYATFEEEFYPEQIPVLGADRCMWASDYPHTDSTFPESRRVIDDTLGVLSEDDRRKVTATNCAELYGFTLA
jgi:predicted TIM-barrel fold metal-dependent hydrolase